MRTNRIIKIRRCIRNGNKTISGKELPAAKESGFGSGFSHVAITNYKDGSNVTRLTPVTAGEYALANEQRL